MNARDRKAFEEYWMSDMNSSTTNRAAMLGAEWGIKYARREMKRRIEEEIQQGKSVCEVCGVHHCEAQLSTIKCNFKLRLRRGK